MNFSHPLKSALLLLCLLAPLGQTAAQVVRSAAGSDAASILPAVTQFRTDLGTLNANVVGSFGSGRREINWDGVPDALAAPNNLPANFFNANSLRGVVFSTPGSGFQVSANAGVGAVQFGNINAAYPQLFEPFSQQRLFTALGSNIVDVSFFVPGSNTPALTTGFGSIFSHADLASTSSLQFFDAANLSLGIFIVPSFLGSETFSFLGVSFANAIVSRVRITSGSQILSAGNNGPGLTVMDDFIFGEPIAANGASVPDATSSLLLLVLALGLLGVVRRSYPELRKA